MTPKNAAIIEISPGSQNVLQAFKNLLRPDGGETMMWALADGPVAVALTRRTGKKPVARSDWCPLRGGTGAKKRNRRHAEAGGKCSGPVSPEIKTSARLNTARNNGNSGNRRQSRRAGANFLQLRHQLLLACSNGGGENDTSSRGDGEW